jgi:hypothetical protein
MSQAVYKFTPESYLWRASRLLKLMNQRLKMYFRNKKGAPSLTSNSSFLLATRLVWIVGEKSVNHFHLWPNLGMKNRKA